MDSGLHAALYSSTLQNNIESIRIRSEFRQNFSGCFLGLCKRFCRIFWPGPHRQDVPVCRKAFFHCEGYTVRIDIYNYFLRSTKSIRNDAACGQGHLEIVRTKTQLEAHQAIRLHQLPKPRRDDQQRFERAVQPEGLQRGALPEKLVHMYTSQEEGEGKKQGG